MRCLRVGGFLAHRRIFQSSPGTRAKLMGSPSVSAGTVVTPVSVFFHRAGHGGHHGARGGDKEAMRGRGAMRGLDEKRIIIAGGATGIGAAAAERLAEE